LVKELGDKNCPTCGQEISKELQSELSTSLEEARYNQEEAAQKEAEINQGLRRDKTELRTIVERLNKKLRKLQRQRIELRSNITSTQRVLEEQKRIEGNVVRTKDKLEECVGDKEGLEGEVIKLEKEVNLLLEVESVLGTEGFRANILGKALNGIEAMANNWLAKVSKPGVYIKLNPYSELKKGGVRDRIQMVVHGVGGGYGYNATSDGERRRIDIALLLALSDFAASTQGVIPGTLFIDEALDGLDDSGYVAVADVLHEVSQQRCIVVISHDENLAQTMRPVKHYKIKEGAVL
jgi:DNA repair exonuclease SbcCD ATPase subunit